jgi:hypothetical protein
MFCVPFNNLTVLTGLAVLIMESALRLVNDQLSEVFMVELLSFTAMREIMNLSEVDESGTCCRWGIEKDNE